MPRKSPSKEKPSKEKPKLYIVRKYIKAVSVKHALRLEPKTDVHDCWVDEGFKTTHLADAIGFHEIERDPEYEEE